MGLGVGVGVGGWVCGWVGVWVGGCVGVCEGKKVSTKELEGWLTNTKRILFNKERASGLSQQMCF